VRIIRLANFVLSRVALHLFLFACEKPEGQARFTCLQALALIGQIDKELYSKH